MANRNNVRAQKKRNYLLGSVQPNHKEKQEI